MRIFMLNMWGGFRLHFGGYKKEMVTLNQNAPELYSTTTSLLS